MIKKFSRISVVFLVTLLLVGIGKANAEEFVISGNGENSQSTVTINRSSDTSVQQTNNGDTKNDVTTTANTGDNSASGNTGGDVGVQTGDASSQTTIDNSVNFSIVQNDCCSTPSSNETSIVGNGDSSLNEVSISSQNNTTITINQNADVSNVVTTNANTGGNSADGNVADVLIASGNITILEIVKNEHINLAHVSVSQSAFVNGNFVLTIVGNGERSENKIFADWFSDLILTINNTIDINNTINTTANTGDNTANGNVGDVEITTGDITIGIDVKNEGNKSITTVTCCEVPQVPVPPTPPPANPSPSGGVGGGGGSSSGGGGGQGGGPGEALAAMLPITGTNWFFATIANILMFLFGLYLRRRSGNSPGMAYLLAA